MRFPWANKYDKFSASSSDLVNQSKVEEAYLQEGESEWDEVEKELGGSHLGKSGEEAKPGIFWGQRLRTYIDPTIVEAFVLTFLAEWGDRSQVS